MIKDNTQVRAYESFLKSYEDKSEVIPSPVTFKVPAFYSIFPHWIPAKFRFQKLKTTSTLNFYPFQVIKMLLIVVCIFSICWLPWQVYMTTLHVYPEINK